MTYSQVLIKRLQELCKERQITINGLANLAGLKQSTVDAIMKGTNRRPRIDTLHKIAVGLSMTISQLLDFPEMNETIFEDE